MSEAVLKRRVINASNSWTEPVMGSIEKESTKKFDDKQIQTSSKQSFVENMCWLAGSIFAIYYSDIMNVMLFDQVINRSLLWIAIILILINIVVAGYLIIWVTFIKKINSDRWSELYPELIATATACFIVGSLVLTIALWPRFTWLTLPLLFTIFMGFIVIVTTLPSYL